jgi:hypothetical protein
MSGYYHYGDNINQYGGHHNTGKATSQLPADTRQALLEIIDLTDVMRRQVSTAQSQVIDESVEILRRGDTTDRSSVRRALGNIAGIAALVGEVGVPVIDAIRKVMTALGVS